MSKLGHLNPPNLWKHFENMCAIPRPSKHEAKIIAYVKEFAEGRKDLNLKVHVDPIGNVFIKKPASLGYENRPSIVMQAHLDMVPQKNSSTQHDFTKDPIQCYVDEKGEFVRAKGTTLGADNGIGVAAALAILEEDDKNFPHGPLECLFTVDEEAGMGGVFNLKPGLLDSKIMLNLDSEAEGEIFIACAGGINTNAKMNYTEEKFDLGTSSGYSLFELNLTGAKGGHSGIEIHLKRANANKLVARILRSFEKLSALVKFDGGTLRNAIPRECFASVIVSKQDEKSFIEHLENFQTIIKNEFSKSDEAIRLSFEKSKSAGQVMAMNSKDTRKFLDVLMGTFNGVKNMIVDMPEVTETSSNMGIVKALNGQIDIRTLQRSAIESHKMEIAQSVRSTFELASYQVVQDTSYPGWSPNVESKTLKVACDLFEKISGGQKAKIMGTHGGLECGLIRAVYPEMDAISFGPTIYGAHSPDERVEIATVSRFYDYLKGILNSLVAQ